MNGCIGMHCCTASAASSAASGTDGRRLLDSSVHAEGAPSSFLPRVVIDLSSDSRDYNEQAKARSQSLWHLRADDAFPAVPAMRADPRKCASWCHEGTCGMSACSTCQLCQDRDSDRLGDVEATFDSRRLRGEPSGAPELPVFGRIVGGEDLEYARQYSFLVSLQTASGSHFCGGTLLASRWVLTAAHCTTRGVFQVQVGVHRLSTKDTTDAACVQTSRVANIIDHSGYDADSIANDISLLELETPIEYAPLTGGLDQEDGYAFEFGSLVTVAGWGYTAEGGTLSDAPQRVAVPIVSNQDCGEAYGAEAITDGMCCAGVAGRDSCQGDSGGPMFVTNEFGHHVLVGIVSWGAGCGRAGYPGVYTRASAYRDWVCGVDIALCGTMPPSLPPSSPRPPPSPLPPPRPSPPPSPPRSPPDSPSNPEAACACTNTCKGAPSFASDNDCDDGGVGAE